MAYGDWIIGSGRAVGEGVVAHIADPWYACCFSDSLETAGEYAGLVVDAGERFFYNFRFQAGIPSEEKLRELCAEAVAVLAGL